MKKLFSILLALALMLGVTVGLAAEPVTLLVWEADGVEGDFIKKAAELFTEQNPHITFNFEGVSHTDAVQKLELDGPTGLGADLYAAPHDKLGQIVVGQLAIPLSDTGKTVLDKDAAADDKFLTGINFYVQGVDGQVPGGDKK